MRKLMDNKVKRQALFGLVVIMGLFVLGLSGVVFAAPDAALGVAGLPVLVFGGMKVYSKEMFNWKGINDYKSNDEKREKIIERAAEFMNEIKSLDGEKMTGPNAQPQGSSTTVITSMGPNIGPDKGYELIFPETDMRASSNDNIEVVNTVGAFTFTQRKPGEPADIQKVPDSDTTYLRHLELAKGINILDSWLRFNKYYKIDELFRAIITGYWKTKAMLYYGLLAILDSSINVAFDTSDIKTINKACATLLAAIEDTAYAVDDESAEFVLTCNPMIAERIWYALNASWTNPNQNNMKVLYNIRVVKTTKIAATSYYISVLGTTGNVRGEWQDLTARPAQRDEIVGGATHVWTCDYNGMIADKRLHRRCFLG